MRILRTLALLGGLLLCFPGLSQEPVRHGGIPDDVFYLMPSFSEGVIYFRGQNPAQGKLNICAVDNTLRFIDKSGSELEATGADNIIRVRIDTVTFLRDQGIFYRMYPVSPEMGVALRREVKVRTDVKEGAYGTTSQTTAVRSYSSVYSDGAIYNLENGKTYPYEVEEEPFLYKGDSVFALSKKNLKKLFPAKKDIIESYFKAGNPVPETVEDTLNLLKQWAD